MPTCFPGQCAQQISKEKVRCTVREWRKDWLTLEREIEYNSVLEQEDQTRKEREREQQRESRGHSERLLGPRPVTVESGQLSETLYLKNKIKPKAGRSEVQGQTQLCSKFRTSLDYMSQKQKLAWQWRMPFFNPTIREAEAGRSLS